MPYFALFYDTVGGFVERRRPHRQRHLEQIDAWYGDGRLVLAGALKPASERTSGGPRDARADEQPGALLVFRVDSAAEVERFAETDPYVTSGLVTRWRVQEWSVVVGEHAVPR